MSNAPRQTITQPGRFIAVVGASGVGKDSVIDGLCAARPELRPVRRAITRPANAGGETFDAVTQSAFETGVADGAFALHWRAHGLSYGIPVSVLEDVGRGRDVVVNLSRGVLAEAAQIVDALIVLHISADPELLAARVANRGRERGADMARRLSRVAPKMPAGLTTIEVDNSGPLEDTIATALAALYPESA